MASRKTSRPHLLDVDFVVRVWAKLLAESLPAEGQGMTLLLFEANHPGRHHPLDRLDLQPGRGANLKVALRPLQCLFAFLGKPNDWG